MRKKPKAKGRRSGSLLRASGAARQNRGGSARDQNRPVTRRRRYLLPAAGVLAVAAATLVILLVVDQFQTRSGDRFLTGATLPVTVPAQTSGLDPELAALIESQVESVRQAPRDARQRAVLGLI